MGQDKLSKTKIIALSGGFDPIHIGHIRMIQSAAKFGDVAIILNSDKWLIRKKGYKFMEWSHRAEILQCIKGVTSVISVDDSDNTVCSGIIELSKTCGIDIFANGGDRHDTNTPETTICTNLGIDLLWSCGGEKIESSSDLVSAMKHKKARA
jgi:cytidyltransferase-like protein